MPRPNRVSTLREYIFSSVLLASLLFAYSKYWHLPTRTKALELKEKVRLLHADLDKSKAALADLNTQLMAVHDLDKDATLKPYVTSNKKLANIVNNLISEDPDLVTILLKSESGQSKDHQDVNFHLQIHGTFPAIGAFIDRLEHAAILAEINTLEISRNERDLDQCTADIGVHARLLTEDEHD